MPTIYRKTAKGQDEIETRAGALAARLRGLLIMVDGRRSSSDFERLLPGFAADALLTLATAGYIETASESAAVPRPAAPTLPSRSVPDIELPNTPVPPPRQPTAEALALEPLRRESVRALIDICGPEAEPLAIRMERAASLQELLPLLDAAIQFVANTRGRPFALEYGTRFKGA